MLPLKTKQSGGRVLPPTRISEGVVVVVFLEEVSRSREKDIVLGIWNVMSLYRAGSLTTAARELARYKLDLDGVQEVRWDEGGTVRAGEYHFFYGKGNENHQLGTGIFVHKRIGSAIKSVEFVSESVSYIVLRGRWCNAIVLNVHATSEEKSDESKDSFMRNLSRFFIMSVSTI